ncbi:hypothetical protein HWV62_22961 [Athelia sp. TMB]|nr:hypothetical protein HWV62_22961 [Athelia sp. TMB]
MKFSASWLLLAFALSVAARPSRQGCKVKESIAHPQGWVKQAAAPADYVIELRIALPQPNFSVLESHLYEVSDPNHERYGAHLSKEEVEAIVAPHDESIDLVNAWLASHGIAESDVTRSPAKDWAYIKVPVSKAEDMLDTKYHIWSHVESGDAAVRTTEYSLPEHLHEHIDLVQPTTLFARFKGMRSTLNIGSTAPAPTVQATGTISAGNGITVDASCNQTITVDCLKQIYNAVGYVPTETKKNAIGITAYLEQYANNADLKAFYEDQVPAAVNSSYKLVLLKGGLNNQTADAAGIEANLDTQFAYGISYPTPGTFWSTGGSPPYIPDENTPTNTNEPYVDWLDYILSHPNPPSTISTSYDDDEQTVPLSYALRACNSFAQLGARGVSLLFSSGDGGVGDGNSDPATTTCKNAKNETVFIPLFPSSCPFVTSVGATNHIPETAVSRFGSGGGFSNYFPRPAYQEFAVSEYLSKLPKGLYKGLYNPAGRGIPDVSAQGDFFRVFYEGGPISVGGTSASSPTFAGFVALLNDYRKSKGLPALGFLNPFLYSKGYEGLNDITVGNNPGCGTEGFNATTGWDPLTGLGTPNFKKLQALIV